MEAGGVGLIQVRAGTELGPCSDISDLLSPLNLHLLVTALRGLLGNEVISKINCFHSFQHNCVYLDSLNHVFHKFTNRSQILVRFFCSSNVNIIDLICKLVLLVISGGVGCFFLAGGSAGPPASHTSSFLLSN